MILNAYEEFQMMTNSMIPFRWYFGKVTTVERKKAD